MGTSLAFILLAANARVLTRAQSKVAAETEARLLAPCCYSQPVGLHLSAEAAEMRQEIEAMAASGQTEAVIVDYYKARYGERILVVPDGKAGKVLFAIPLVALIVVSALFLSLLPRVITAHPCSQADKDEFDSLRKEFGEVIEQHLRDMA